MVPAAAQFLLALLAIPAAVVDLKSRRISNWITLPGLILGICLNVYLFGMAGLWTSAKGLGLALLIYCPLYLLRGVGAGDVKLMAAVGAITGASSWLQIFIIASLFGGIAALILAASKGRLRKTLSNVRLILGSLLGGVLPYHANPQLEAGSKDSLGLPHAVSVACGAAAFLILSRN